MRLSGTSKDKIIIAATLPATLSHWRLVDSVWVKDFRRTGVICRRARRPRSYVVDMESGVQIEGNRKMLVKQTPSRVPDSYDESYEFPPILENPETSDQPNSEALQ
ncbi:hypothetical protein MTO96_045659, partial [Rhipicephalus appendiculatus]